MNLLNNELTDTFLETDMAKDYVKALNIKKQGKNTASTSLAPEARKVREEAQKFVKSRSYKDLTPASKLLEERRYTLNFIREIEKEKLYYYLLAASNPQPVLVVQSPSDKEQEKKFLGYEWSNRKGDEGIHYLNTGKIKSSSSDDEEADDDTIEQIKGIDGIQTPMFDPLNLEDNTKLNAMIRQNFDRIDIDVLDELEHFVSQNELVDLLDFSRVEFDKIIKTVATLSYPRIETKFESVKLANIAPFVSTKVALSKIDVKTYVSTENMLQNRAGVQVFEGQPSIDKITEYHNGDILISNIRPYLKKIWKAEYNGGCSNDVLVFRNVKTNKVLDEYLYSVLSSDIFFDYMMVGKKGVKMPRGDKKMIPQFEIPLPPMDVQKKIVEECEKIDMQMQQNKRQIRKMKEQAVLLFEQSLQKETTEVRLSQICDMRAGKFVPASEIVDKPMGKYIYPCYGGNGLRGFTDTMTNEGDYILIGRQGALCGNVCVASGQFHATEHAVVVYPNAEVDEKWLRYLLVHMDLNQYSTGRAQPGLSVQKLLNVKANIPIDKNIQSQTAERILTIENEIAKLQYFVDSCPTAKQAILDK